MRYYNFGPNRTYCDALEDMRKVLDTACPDTIHSTRIILNSLVEECQVYGNRMEAGLMDKADLKSWHEVRAELKREIEVLEKRKKELSEND